MKKLVALLVSGIMMLSASISMAVPISGQLNFFGVNSYLTGGPTLADATITNDLSQATGIDFLSEWTLGTATGTYASIPNWTPVATQDFLFSPSLNPTPVSPLWSITLGNGNKYSFDMTSVTAVFANGGLVLSGDGMLHATNFDDTRGSWILSTQGSGAQMIFSATASTVPEPGTFVLLGAGILGIGLYGRRRMQ